MRKSAKCNRGVGGGIILKPNAPENGGEGARTKNGFQTGYYPLIR